MIVSNLKITHRFKLFEHIALDANKQLWQLEHYNKITKRIKPTRKLTYNQKKNAYRINSSWVKKTELQILCYKFHFTFQKSNNWWD